MWQIIQAALGNVLGAVIITALGIGGTTVVINRVTGSYNSRKKWRILMVISVIAALVVGATMTTYIGGFAHYSEAEQSALFICGLLFVIGWIGNFVNK